jgi:hypothetical protein
VAVGAETSDTESAVARAARGGDAVRAVPASVARQRYGLLFVATIASLGVQGALRPGGVQQVVVTALAGTTLLLAFRAANLRPRLVAFAGTLAVAALAVSVLRAAGGGVGDGAARAMNAALVAMGPPAVAVGVVRDLRASGRVRIQTVMGVLCFYTLVGMLFGFVYGTIDRLGGDPFFAGGQSATVSHCLYFSFTTLMTVGYGDFVARSDAGHTLAVFEALLGQIYLVTVVSLIVSNLRAPAQGDAGSAREP